MADFFNSNQKDEMSEFETQTPPVNLKLLGWRLDWPPVGIPGTRWCGADNWMRKDRMVALGATAIPFWGDPAHAPSSGPIYWPVHTCLVLKDHQIAQMVNKLRDVAREFHHTQQLRSQIVDVLLPILKPGK
jgi:hypothetical protein